MILSSLVSTINKLQAAPNELRHCAPGVKTLEDTPKPHARVNPCLSVCLPACVSARLSLAHSLALPPSLPPSLTPSLTHSLTHSLTPSLSLSLSLSHSHSHSFSRVAEIERPGDLELDVRPGLKTVLKRVWAHFKRKCNRTYQSRPNFCELLDDGFDFMSEPARGRMALIWPCIWSYQPLPQRAILRHRVQRCLFFGSKLDLLSPVWLALRVFAAKRNVASPAHRNPSQCVHGGSARTRHKNSQSGVETSAEILRCSSLFSGPWVGQKTVCMLPTPSSPAPATLCPGKRTLRCDTHAEAARGCLRARRVR